MRLTQIVGMQCAFGIHHHTFYSLSSYLGYDNYISNVSYIENHCTKTSAMTFHPQFTTLPSLTLHALRIGKSILIAANLLIRVRATRRNYHLNRGATSGQWHYATSASTNYSDDVAVSKRWCCFVSMNSILDICYRLRALGIPYEPSRCSASLIS
jgi:hypothetical protein